MLHPGETFTVPEGVKHWHGAMPGHSFQYIAVMEASPTASTEWLEAVDSAAVLQEEVK